MARLSGRRSWGGFDGALAARRIGDRGNAGADNRWVLGSTGASAARPCSPVCRAAAPAAPVAVGAAHPKVAGIDVDTTPIPQLEKLMNAHRLTSVQLVRFYLARIHRLNPKLHAVITVSRTAVADARAADRYRRKYGAVRRPLLGIPVIVKDNIDTTRMPTTAGSLALAGSTPRGRLHRAAAQEGRRAGDRQGQPLGVGQLPRAPSPPAAGARWAARPRTRTCSTATPAGRAPDPPSSPQPISRRSRWARRRTDRSSARPARTATWASSRPSAWPAAAGSSRSRSSRTPPAPSPATSPTPRSCSAP